MKKRDQWDKIIYPDITKEENEIIRKASRAGFATFYNGTNHRGERTLSAAKDFLVAQFKEKYPFKFDHHNLDADLQTFQLWQGGIMMTAQLRRMDAISGIKEGRYFIMTGQAVGAVTELY